MLPAPGREIGTENLLRSTQGATLSRGLARSYGDSSLPPPDVGVVVSTVRADRMLAFDPDTGVLRAEAGCVLRDVIWTFLPRNWFVPVTPGTSYVTLGGMVASDVHGKNHHVAGCFGEHVTALKMRLADDTVVEVTPDSDPDLFWATVGGMGLTGHILEVAFKMVKIPSPWIYEESLRIRDLEEFVATLKASADDFPFSVGWLDSLARGRNMGRGILFRGRWATPEECAAAGKSAAPTPRKVMTVPMMAPSWALNRLTARIFNEMVYRKHGRRTKQHVQHPGSHFHPLDSLRHWNRLYGRKGFTQHQAVIPDEAGLEKVAAFLRFLTESGGLSFLSVIKDCGPEGRGVLSFPRRGTSIALDIPVRRDTQQLVDALNEKVLEFGGRMYLTKDAFTRGDHYRAMEGDRFERFMTIRKRVDPHLRIRSRQSVRMFGDPAEGPLALPAGHGASAESLPGGLPTPRAAG